MLTREYQENIFFLFSLYSTRFYLLLPFDLPAATLVPSYHSFCTISPFPLFLLSLWLYLCLAVHSQPPLYFLHSLSSIQVNFVGRDERGSDCHLVSLGTDPFQDDTRVGPDRASKIRRQPHANDAPFLRTFKLLLDLTEIRHSIYNL